MTLIDYNRHNTTHGGWVGTEMRRSNRTNKKETNLSEQLKRPVYQARWATLKANRSEHNVEKTARGGEEQGNQKGEEILTAISWLILTYCVEQVIQAILGS